MIVLRFLEYLKGSCGCDRMVIGFTLQLPLQSVSITIEVVSLNHTQMRCT